MQAFATVPTSAPRSGAAVLWIALLLAAPPLSSATSPDMASPEASPDAASISSALSPVVPALSAPLTPAGPALWAGLRPVRPALSGAPPTVAWHRTGHAIVCEIAWLELDEPARRAARELLALDDEFDSFAPACEWPDLVRDRPEFLVFDPAHYVNLSPGAPGVSVPEHCAETVCVIEAIELFAGTLRDPTATPRRRLEALKFLGHLVGDVHQPLHVGYAADRGGNDTPACVPGHPDVNLHWVWDGWLAGRALARRGVEWRAYAEALRSDIHPVQRVAWRSLDPRAWADESWAIVEDEVYDEIEGECLPEGYAERHLLTVERRLKQAGFRLGLLLNDILGGFDQEP